jgi:hypothetical protein
MKKSNCKSLTVVELVDQFAAICFEQDKAEFEDDIATYNRLYDQKVAVLDELKERPGDQRTALLRLYEHSNLQVKLQAAKATLAVAPEAARRMLREIESWGRQPYAGDAGMCLVSLDRGIFVPK